MYHKPICYLKLNFFGLCYICWTMIIELVGYFLSFGYWYGMTCLIKYVIEFYFDVVIHWNKNYISSWVLKYCYMSLHLSNSMSFKYSQSKPTLRLFPRACSFMWHTRNLKIFKRLWFFPRAYNLIWHLMILPNLIFWWPGYLWKVRNWMWHNLGILGLVMHRIWFELLAWFETFWES